MSLTRALTRRAAQFTLVGALAATPLALAAGTASATDWDAIAQCESSGNWHTNTGNGFGGGLQFTDSTWHAFGGKGSPENASREQQIQVAEKVKAGQGMGAWPVCSKKAGQTSNAADDSGSSSSSATAESASSSSSSSGSGSSGSSAHQGSGSARPAAAGGTYTVVSGDTLSSIAAAHGGDVASIAQRNGVADPDVITPGQQLVLG
nr:transglycosylase family protein [Actinomycetospora sp. TBRC 11914]